MPIGSTGMTRKARRSMKRSSAASAAAEPLSQCFDIYGLLSLTDNSRWYLSHPMLLRSTNTGVDDIGRSLAKLYTGDADWNALVEALNTTRIERQVRRADMFKGFVGDLSDIPLQTLEPKMNAVVYRTSCDAWEPLRAEDLYSPGVYLGMKINPHQRVAIFVTRSEEQAASSMSGSCSRASSSLQSRKRACICWRRSFRAASSASTAYDARPRCWSCMAKRPDGTLVRNRVRRPQESGWRSTPTRRNLLPGVRSVIEFLTQVVQADPATGAGDVPAPS
jgi:hypothetical protein